MADPLRELFLEAGVDDKPAVLALSRITKAADIAEQALLGVGRASQFAGMTGGATRANVALAQSYNTLSAAATRAGTAMRSASMTGAIQAIRNGQAAPILQRPFLAGAGNSPFSVVQGGVGPGAALALQRAMASAPYSTGLTPTNVRNRGNFGLGTSIFLTGLGLKAGSYGYGQNANLQRYSTLASFASGQSPSAMAAQSMGLRSDYSIRLAAATALTQEVAQLGAMTPQGQREIGRAGAGFNVLEPTVAAGEASKAIYQLLKATSHSSADFDRASASATRYAGAIYAAGNESAAGAGEVFSMVQELGPLSQMMNLGAEGTIALSAAFADLNAGQREMFRGALTRMTIQGKLDPNNPIGSLLSIAERLRNATNDSDRLNILKSLGFTNIRDVQTVSVMAASLDTFARSLSVVKQELTGTSTFASKIDTVLGDPQGSIDALKSSTDAASASIMGGLYPALGLVLNTLTGIADTIAHNPGLAILLGVGGGLLAGKIATNLYRRHMGGPALAEVLADMAPYQRRAYGRTSRAISSLLPVGISKRLAVTGFGVNLAEGAYLGQLAGAGRMSSLGLGLMRSIPGIGTGLAESAAGAMAAGGLGGTAIRLATGPVGWVITALSLGIPLFERIAIATERMGKQGGLLGIALNTVSLIFDVMAAGGRLLNTAFSWLGTGGKWLLNLVTFGHADDLLGGVNAGLQAAQGAIRGIAASPASAAPQSPINVNVYTGGSQSGFQTAMDEASRRAARTMPATSYGGLTV